MTDPRHSKPLLNFDSLTDTVTNLAGALILLVVLILGITGQGEASRTEPLLEQLEQLRVEIQSVDQETRQIEDALRVLQQRLDRVADQAGPSQMTTDIAIHRRLADAARLLAVAGGARPPRAFLAQQLGVSALAVAATSTEDRFQRWQAALAESDRRLQDLERRMADLEDNLRRLLQRAQAALPAADGGEPARPAIAAAAAPPTKQLKLRPPLEQLTTQEALIVCCRDSRVSCVDLAALNRSLARLRQRRPPTAAAREPFQFDLPDCPMRCEGFMEGRVGTGQFKEEVILNFKPGEHGESEQELARAESRFQQALSQHRPEKCYLQFGIWPDSYELFLKVRDLAWQAGYDVGWVPLDTGEPIRLGKGLGRKY